MKTTFNRTDRSRTTKLTARPVRLIAPRLSPRAANRGLSPVTVFSRTTSPVRQVTPAEPAARDLAHGDVLQLYLREIGQVKLLTRQEEIVLANRIRRGDQRAREHMIKANLRLVVKIAHDYVGM